LVLVRPSKFPRHFPAPLFQHNHTLLAGTQVLERFSSVLRSQVLPAGEAHTSKEHSSRWRTLSMPKRRRQESRNRQWCLSFEPVNQRGSESGVHAIGDVLPWYGRPIPFRRLFRRTHSGRLLPTRRNYVQAKTFSQASLVVLSPGAGAQRGRSRYRGNGDLGGGSRGSRSATGPPFWHFHPGTRATGRLAQAVRH